MSADRPSEIPVLLIIFNRPGMTAEVLRALQTSRPTRLLVAADGPRADRPGDIALCDETRRLIESMVNWPCEVTRNYSLSNLGCDHRPASAIEWALEQHEEIIVLEDDCVPHPDFFRFVAAMLERYRDDDRVMLISGINVLKGRRTLPYSYAFSRYYLTWGWATWRRSWKRYDFAIKKWPEIRDAGLLWDLLGDKREVEYWTKAFEDVWHHKIDAWDFQLHLAMWLHQAYAIYPASNLITNIGVEGTHYSVALPTQNIATTELPFPLHHPPAIYRDIRADELIRSTWYLPPLGEQFRRKARRAIKRLRRS